MASVAFSALITEGTDFWTQTRLLIKQLDDGKKKIDQPMLRSFKVFSTLSSRQNYYVPCRSVDIALLCILILSYNEQVHVTKCIEHLTLGSDELMNIHTEVPVWNRF